MFFGTCAGVVQDFLHQPSQKRRQQKTKTIFCGTPPNNEWGGCGEYATQPAHSKQQMHVHSISTSKQSPAQQIKAITSPAQPRKAEQKFSQAKPSMRASNTKHTRPKTQSIRLAYHFNSFRVGCVHTSCRALPLRLTVCLYLNSCPQSSLHTLISYNARRRLEEILG